MSGGEFMSGIRIDDFDFDVGERTTDTAEFDVIMAVGGDDGTGFGGSVTFQNNQVVLFDKGFPDIVRHFIRPGHGDPDTCKIPELSLAQVAGEEYRSSYHQTTFLFPDDLTDDPVFQGIGIGYDRHSIDQRQPEIDILTEYMKQGKIGQHDIGTGIRQGLTDSLDIGTDVAVCELDRFRILFAAAGEQNHQIITIFTPVNHMKQDR